MTASLALTMTIMNSKALAFMYWNLAVMNRQFFEVETIENTT